MAAPCLLDKVLLLGVLLTGVGAAPHCPGKLQQLSSPNCGVEDPECPVEAPFHRTNISVDGAFRYVETSYCPPYDWSCLSNQKARRPCARKQTFKIPLEPTPPAAEGIPLGLGWPRASPAPAGAASADVPTSAEALNALPSAVLGGDVRPMLGAIAVLLNGVALNGVATKLSEALPADVRLEGSDRWVDAVVAEAWMDDGCLGHLSGGGNYHTHAGRWSPEQRIACGLPQDDAGQHSPLLGWAFDGHGLFGPHDALGQPPTDLDACGGHAGLTATGESQYHYHMTDVYPYALECYRSCPEPSNNFRFKDLPCAKRAAQSKGEL